MSLKENYNETIARLRDDRYFEMATVQSEFSNLPYEMWIDQGGFVRGTPHGPRVKISIKRPRDLSISLSPTDPQVKAGKVPDSELSNVNKVIEFIKIHYLAFDLHYKKVWQDTELLFYIMLVGKNKLSIKDALLKMLEQGVIDKIPEVYAYLFEKEKEENDQKF
jgi:hypothetical protein